MNEYIKVYLYFIFLFKMYSRNSSQGKNMLYNVVWITLKMYDARVNV